MTDFTSRAYSGPSDLDAMIHLVEQRPPDRVTEFPSIVDLREIFGAAGGGDTEIPACLWTDSGGQIVAFAFMDGPNLTFEIAPEIGADPGAAIIAWAVDQAGKRYPAPDQPPVVEASCPDGDGWRLALLEQHGFVRQPECSLHYARSLAEPVPPPVLPDGFTIRPLAGEHEAAAWVALHRAAWDTENMTLDYRLSMMRVPGYDPALDLVAVAPDGRLAAYCVCYISAEENALSGRQDGYADPIATHPAFQRQGLARALVLHGLRLLAARGMTTARTGTSSQNLAMQRTAEAAGFRVVSRALWFSKPLG